MSLSLRQRDLFIRLGRAMQDVAGRLEFGIDDRASAEHVVASLRELRAVLGDARASAADLPKSSLSRTVKESLLGCYDTIVRACDQIALADGHKRDVVRLGRNAMGRALRLWGDDLERVAVKLLVAADDGLPAEDTTENDVGIVLEAGGFAYDTHFMPMSGRDFDVLRAFCEAPRHSLTAAELLSDVWAESPIEQDGVKVYVRRVRAKLVSAIRKVDDHYKGNPVPCIGSGRNLAWKLDLPRSFGINRN